MTHMAFIVQLALAFFIALVLSGLLVLVIAPDRRDHGLAGYAGVTAVIWFVTMAIGAWMVPFGPLAFGVPWLGFVLVGVMVLLIIAAVPAQSRRIGVGADAPAAAHQRSDAVFGVVFWILIALAAALVIARLGTT
jgi:hypothetical protein